MKMIFFLLIIALIQSSLQQITILPPDTGARVCEGDSITLQCRVQFSGVAVPGTWRRDGTEIDVDNSTLSNHFIVPFNSTGEELIGLIITKVNLTDNNTTVYSCTFIGIDPPDSTTLYVAGPPPPIGMITVNDETCSVNFNISWDPVSSDQVCGSLLYNVTISPSDGVTMTSITDTSYTFNGLVSATTYIVTVTSRNNAGVGQSMMTSANTTNITSVLPDLSELINANTTHNTIVVEWEVTSNLFCGDTLLNVTIHPTSQRIISGIIVNNTATFSNLENGTTYTITVTATNRAGNVTRMIDVDTLGPSPRSPNDGDDSGGGAGEAIGGAIGGVVAVIIVVGIVILVIFCYKKKKGETDTDKTALRSPTGTSTGGRSTVTPSSNFQSGPTEVYADVQKPAANVPHQTAATGEEYAVSTKASKPGKGKPQGPTEEYAQIDKSKKSGQQGIQYADLADLPQSTNDPSTKGPTSMYAQVA